MKTYSQQFLNNLFSIYLETDGLTDIGDTFTVSLPYSGTLLQVNDFYDGEYYTVSVNGNSVTITCTESLTEFDFWFVIQTKNLNNNDYFWFEPMENELAIAASEVEVKGGTATAKISGDYALSYDIMKWLEDHPGVTLEYTLTYEGEEHLIVIPGGTKLANTEIPWYGPKYLIKYFEQR